MTAPRRDPEVVSWLRRPLWWLLALPFIAALFAGPAVADLWTQAQIERVGVGVSGTILGSWDGGARVPVSFTPPRGGEPVSATAWGPADADRAIGPVALQADPDDVTRVRLAGPLPTHDVVETAILLGCILAALMLWLASRHRSIRRSERLAASDQPSYRMVGVPAPGRFARRRWRMHLYPLDVPPGSPPVCTVPIIGGAGSTIARPVEVKEEPRPGGAVVAIESGRDRIYWPAGRVLVTGRAPLPEPARPAVDLDAGRNRWWLLGLGALLFVYTFAAAEDPRALEERSETTKATVVQGHGTGVSSTPVRFDIDGQEYASSPSLAGPQRKGDQVTLAYDPESPTRTWQPGTSRSIPGTAPPLADLAFIAAILLIALGIVFALPPRRDRWAGGRGGGLLPLR